VFDGLSERDAKRVVGAIAFEAIRSGWVMTAAADTVTDQAIAVQLNRHSDLEDRMAVELALHPRRGC
jgi:hypothetical protein